MASYVVMEPPESDRDAVLVRDGVNLLAFPVPFLWLLVQRCWMEAAIAFAVAVGLAILGSMAGFAGAPALSFLVSVFVVLEGAALRVAALRRAGWREWGVVEAETASDAELRYLAEKHGDEIAQPPAAYSLAATPSRAGSSGAALGLFSYPGRG